MFETSNAPDVAGALGANVFASLNTSQDIAPSLSTQPNRRLPILEKHWAGVTELLRREAMTDE